MLESKRKWAFVSIAVVVLLIVVLILSFTRTGAEPLDEIEIRDLIEGQFGGSIQSIAQTNVNGKTVYEVELLEAAGLYQVIVDPTTGEILSLEHVLERGEVSVKPEESVVNTISVDEVEEKIEDSFGKNYSDLHINLGEKAGKLIYEITVSQENSYSDVEMDAQTGEILLITSRDKKERESETDSSQRAEVIGEQEAVRIALTHVAGTVDDVELDEEDGRLIYEIEIEVGDLEAEVYLDAFTGELITIKWED
ncbi:PepSY domain-containing protein [Halalkalibacter krulwichiae]|nr:PepSY domain-containing protein [Halalkalibacter krulwichiae]